MALSTKNTAIALPLEGVDSEHCALIVDKSLRDVKGLSQHKIELNNKKIDRDDPNNLTVWERFGNFDEMSDIGKTAQERKAEVMLRDRIANNKMIFTLTN